MLYSLLSEQNVEFDHDKPFVRTFYENCFKITLTVYKDGKQNRVRLDVCPEDVSGYELLVSFVISLNNADNWVDYDLWKTEQTAFDLAIESDTLKLSFGLDVHDVLAPKNLRVSGGFRTLKIVASGEEYFVNAAALKDLGGSLFNDWYNQECVGENTIEVTELDNIELDTLLTACSAYSTVVVTRQNFDILLRISWKYKIVAVLRSIEQYLLNSKGIHIISKLDIAYNYKFAMLCSYVLKNIGNKFKRKELLLDYLNKNNIPLCPNYLTEILEIQYLT